MASIHKPVLRDTVTLTGDVPHDYLFIGYDNKLTATPGQPVKGVSAYGGKAGSAVPVTLIGTVEVRSAGTFAAGDRVCAGAGGVAIPYANGHAVAGYALSAAAAGSNVNILLK